MKKYYPLSLAFVLILSACGVQATPKVIESVLVTEATEQVAANNPTSGPSQEPAPTITLQPNIPTTVTYQIVAGESRLQYEVGEVLFNENNRFNVAVGVTTQISGEILVDLAEPQNSSLGPITADISQFTSDNNRRDNALRDRFIESARYPNVTFVTREIKGLPDSYQEGQMVPLQISGDLTIRETTKPVTFETTVKIEANVMTAEATTTILMSDFNFGPISVIGILKTEDEAVITFSFIARPSVEQ